jgi:hypothetical protein
MRNRDLAVMYIILIKILISADIGLIYDGMS